MLSIDRQDCCTCSKVELPLGTELAIFSPSATDDYTQCARSCMHVTPDSVPPSGKLTSTPMEGGHQPLTHWVRWLWLALDALPDHMLLTRLHARRVAFQQKQCCLPPQGNLTEMRSAARGLFLVHAERSLLAHHEMCRSGVLLVEPQAWLYAQWQCNDGSPVLEHGAACTIKLGEDLSRCLGTPLSSRRACSCPRSRPLRPVSFAVDISARPKVAAWSEVVQAVLRRIAISEACWTPLGGQH